MSIRGADGQAKSDDGQERRSTGQRVHFEALVAVGEMTGNGGFEAESVDVSPEGMRLRTAFLPTIGDKLVCRFDGPGAEVLAEGEVIWVNEEAKGGEFGLRFMGLDEQAAEAVRSMVSSLSGGDQAGEEEPAIARGARVRLHIEGLGSPMKARVRESAAQDVEVGSNLEFLRVGRSLELEDVDQGAKREAFVDHVKVDVDPSTNVPQLVVSLRFSPERAADAPRPEAKSEAPRTQRADERKAEKAAKAEIEAEGADEGDEDAMQEGAAARAAKAGRAALGHVGPAISGIGARAKGAMAGLFGAIQKRRAERAETKRANAPKRMTAPPPAGALKSEGRKLVREDEGDELAPPPRSRRRAAAIGSILGLAAVIAVFGATRYVSARAGSGAAHTPPALPAATAEAQQQNAPPGTLTATVPLFGTTPLSTTETVPSPAPSAASAAPDASNAPSAPPADEPSEAKISKEWGQGPVSHPVVLKLKMDGPVEGITGSAGAMGFTITVPNRRAISSANELARKDKRLASVNVVNTSHGCDVTVQFKDGVPPYLAKVKGERLEIAIGKESSKVAKKKGDDKPKGKHHKKK